jgi:hypothetical protein
MCRAVTNSEKSSLQWLDIMNFARALIFENLCPGGQDEAEGEEGEGWGGVDKAHRSHLGRYTIED